MRQLATICCAMCVIVLCAGSPALAEPIYQFAFDQPNYSVAPGAKVDVKVYWQEDQGILNSSSGAGVYTLGTTIRFDDPPQPTNLAKVVATEDIAHNPAFNDSSPDIRLKEATATYARLTEATSNASEQPVFGTVVSGDLRQVLVGTFSFTGATTPGVTHIRAKQYQLTAEGDTIWDCSFNSYDSQTTEATATITTTIPEPSSFVLSAIAALAILAWHCWKRRRGTTAWF